MKALIKSIVYPAIGVLALFSAVTYTSCNDDPCKAVACAYGGTCNDGECICPSGYEGTSCEVVVKDRYLGTWTVFEDGTVTDAAQYEVNIRSGETPTDVKISNFYNRFGANDLVNARIDGDSIFIAQQKVNGYSIEGWGWFDWVEEDYYPDAGKLTMYYTITNSDGKTDDFGVNGGMPSEWNK